MLCVFPKFISFYAIIQTFEPNAFYPAFFIAAPTNSRIPTSSPPVGFTPGTRDTVHESFPPLLGGVSQADGTPHLITAPSGSPESLTPVSTLKPVSSQESKALGSTATAMVVSTTAAGDSSVSQHCKSKVNANTYNTTFHGI